VRDYESLPDSMPPDEIAVLFAELLATPLDSVTQTMDALCQLADRQWHAYQPLDASIHQRVDAWLIANWDSTSLAFAEAASTIVGHLGLPGSWSKIKSGNHANSAVAAEFREFIAEMERGDPLDPWSGMPRP
jgi:hypothetical protein